METKKRRVRRTPESYRKEVEEITSGEYSVPGRFRNTGTKITHRHEKCGHEWEVSPNNFINIGSRCPKCDNIMNHRKTNEQFLSEVFELVGDEYTFLEPYTKAIDKTKVRHNTCGLEYEVRPSLFLQGTRCPGCAHDNRQGIGGAMLSHGIFCARVESQVGDEYSVMSDYRGSRVKVLMRHNLCGKEYEVSPVNFLGGSRCVGCTHKLRSRFEDTIGDSFKLLEDARFLTDKARVKHRECGREFSAQLVGLVLGKTSCPHCADLFMISDEEFKKRVYDLVGEEYVFMEPYVNNKKQLEVKHVTCGHSYAVRPSAFTIQGSRCPNCVYSRGEKAIADVLDSLSIEYIREHSFEYLGRKRYDFYIPSLNIAIEYDGEQHFKAVDHWGGEEALKRTQESDALKNDFCDFMGIDLLRIPHWEFDNIDEIVTNFIDTVKLMRSISNRKEA